MRPPGDGKLNDQATDPGFYVETEPVAETQPALSHETVHPWSEPLPAERLCLEFTLPPNDVARLLRAPALVAIRAGRMRTMPAHMVWHDTASAQLARAGLALAEQRGEHRGEHTGAWQLSRLHPGAAAGWLPAHAAPVLADGATPDDLGAALPQGLVPIAAFNGRRRVLALGGAPGGAGHASLTLLDGTVRGVAEDFPTARVMLEGAASPMAALARALCEHAALSVPRASLAAEATALATNRPIRARASGIPDMPRGASADEALGLIAAHLADVILHWAALVPHAASPEPVHQMRVAVRRLRSALSLFRRASGEGLKQDFSPALKSLASALGEARDWDVFLGGTGGAIGSAFAGDRRIEGLLAAAARRRAAAYDALRDLFASAAWRRLAMELALLPTLRPWVALGDASVLHGPAAGYAAAMLHRRARHLLAPGPDLSGISGEALHDIRKQAKRLRYAGEFFAPLFAEKPTRKYLRRLADLQEALGSLNDGATAAALVGRLGGGADRAFAAGCVQGFLAAGSLEAKAEAHRAWDRLHAATPFW